MVKIKQVIHFRIKRMSSWDSMIEQINAVLKEYQDKNGELVTVTNIGTKTHAIIQFDA